MKQKKIRYPDINIMLKGINCFSYKIIFILYNYIDTVCNGFVPSLELCTPKKFLKKSKITVGIILPSLFRIGNIFIFLFKNFRNF